MHEVGRFLREHRTRIAVSIAVLGIAAAFPFFLASGSQASLEVQTACDSQFYVTIPGFNVALDNGPKGLYFCQPSYLQENSPLE